MKILLVGFGTVGQGFVDVLHERAAYLRTAYNLQPQIVGVATGSRGAVYNAEGYDLQALLTAPERIFAESTATDTATFIRERPADVVLEVTPSNLQTAQPALAHCRAALESGKHLVLANKGPVVVAHDDLHALAASHGRQIRYEATVMAGTPVISTAQSLAAAGIRRVSGILNGTTNFMLSTMETGVSYEQALQQAQTAGYAESDPSADVEGWDAAGKAVILMAAVFGQQIALSDVHVEGITGITAEDIAAARDAGECYRLVATVTAEGASVQPQRLPQSHPFAMITGATNGIRFETDALGAVTITGAGAGRRETGYALLSDMVALRQTLTKSILS